MRNEETSCTLCLLKTGEPRSFAIILSIPDLDDKVYVANPFQILLLVIFCPLCLADSVERKLACDGGYSRWIPVGGAVEAGWIFRKYCARCDTSFSLIPEFVLCYRQYGRTLVSAWLWACLLGTPSRCRSFLEDQGIWFPRCDAPGSWSDLLDDQRTHPGYQLLCHWTRLFSRQSQRAIPALLGAFIALRCDFQRDLAEPLALLTRVPVRAYALGLALGLWRAVREASDPFGQSVGLQAALPSLVEHLVVGCGPASHGLRRAFPGVLRYDGSSQGGRSPPDLPGKGGH